MKQWALEEREKAIVQVDETINRVEIVFCKGRVYDSGIIDLQRELKEAQELLENATCKTWELGNKRQDWLERNKETK